MTMQTENDISKLSIFITLETPRAVKDGRDSARSANDNRMITSQRSSVSTTKNNDDEKTPRRTNRMNSFGSMNDDEADYKKIFQKLDPDNELGLGSKASSRASTRRSSNDVTSRQLVNHNRHQDLPPMIEPLVGLTDTPGSTQRSIDENSGQSKKESASQRTTGKAKKFGEMYPQRSGDSDQ